MLKRLHLICLAQKCIQLVESFLMSLFIDLINLFLSFFYRKKKFRFVEKSKVHIMKIDFETFVAFCKKKNKRKKINYILKRSLFILTFFFTFHFCTHSLTTTSNSFLKSDKMENKNKKFIWFVVHAVFDK